MPAPSPNFSGSDMDVILATLTLALSASFGMPCTGLDPMTGRAVVVDLPSVVFASYGDYGRDPYGPLGYDRPLPRAAWPSVHAAEAALIPAAPERMVVRCAEP
jgi:hypothetical protein